MLESSVRAHGYLFLAGVVILLFFLAYVYFCNHQTEIYKNNLWISAFQEIGLTPRQIDDITHDDSMWYYLKRPTCVGYGGYFTKKCPKYENYCSGGSTFGNPLQQALAVKKAIYTGGEHPSCPLVYPGTA